MTFKGSLTAATLLGLAAGLTASLIGGSWQVVTRQSTMGSLGPGDLMWLRYFIPTLVLLPLTWRTGQLPQGLPRRWLALIVGVDRWR